MKKTSKFMLLFLAAGMLFSTTNVNNTTVNAQENSSSTSVSSVKDAISKLINSRNYTIEVSTKAGPIDINYDVYYTENAFYDSYLGDEYGYVQLDDGVFSFDLYQDGIGRDFTASKPLVDNDGNKITSIWEEALFQGFYKLKVDEFKDATGNTFEATSKRVKNLFLNLFKLDYGYYQYVNPVKFTVGNDINTLQFEFTLSTGQSYTGKISNFGTTTIDVVESYLENNNFNHINIDIIEELKTLQQQQNKKFQKELQGMKKDIQKLQEDIKTLEDKIPEAIRGEYYWNEEKLFSLIQEKQQKLDDFVQQEKILQQQWKENKNRQIRNKELEKTQDIQNSVNTLRNKQLQNNNLEQLQNEQVQIKQIQDNNLENSFSKICPNWKLEFRNADIATKKMLLFSIIDKIEVKDNDIYIKFKIKMNAKK